MLQKLCDRLNRKKYSLEARGWKGEAVYQWLCLIAGRYLRRYAQSRPTDPDWEVYGWAIGRQLQGPQILFDITQDRVRVFTRDGHKAWERHTRI